MAVMAKLTPIAAPRLACLVLACLLLPCSGCSGRFRTETYYVASGFTVESLRGKTVAVLPVADAAASVTQPTSAPGPTSAPVSAPADRPVRSLRGGGEFLGVAGGLREAGARVRLLSPEEGDRAAARPGDVAAAYLLVVRLIGSDVYHGFAPRRGDRSAERAVSRTTGRRVGLRLTLLRLPEERPVWLAGGTGDVWVTRQGPADYWPAGRDTPAAPGSSNRFAGGFALYPPPPARKSLSRRLTRRLIADLPVDTELEPN